jgi:RNA polymerase-binding transcription factor DksA
MIDTQKFKSLLEAELKKLEEDLSKVGIKNPDNTEDWQAKPEVWDATGADTNELSDVMDEFEQNTSELKQLEIMWRDVKNALKKIENGTYGIDEVDGTEIPEDRLLANPSARTKVENAHLLRD